MGAIADPRDRAAITPDLVDRYRAGASLDQLAAWSGLSDSTVRRWLIAAGVTLRRAAYHSTGHEDAAAARELLILNMISRGATNADIAEALYVTPNTVKTHLRRLYRKHGVTCRAGLMGVAFRTGLLDPSDHTEAA